MSVRLPCIGGASPLTSCCLAKVISARFPANDNTQAAGHSGDRRQLGTGLTSKQRVLPEIGSVFERP